MIAQIIVDVPNRLTDRPFDYLVPEAMNPWIEVGSRVGVPFGGRVLQGFVVSISDHTDVQEGKLKPIAELLDSEPPLLPDLVELARWISQKYCCSWTVSLQAMLPAALKGKAKKWVRVGDLDELYQMAIKQWLPMELVDELAGSPKKLDLDLLIERYPAAGKGLKSALQSGALIQQIAIKDRISVRMVKAVIAKSPPDQLLDYAASLAKRSPKQRMVLEYMAVQPRAVLLQKVLTDTGVSAATVQALVSKGLIGLEEVEQLRDPYADKHFAQTKALELNKQQHEVYERIIHSLHSEKARPLLLHGITGSGKTEIYMQAIQHCLDSDKQAIVLVPEIALTPQMVERFKGRFGDKVAVLHSRLSQGERYDEWRKIRTASAQVAIGARSAVFAPFRHIGLIIMDEEHESSYKQEENPKYHARDVAIFRARQHGATVVLGSATPSLESYAAAERTDANGENSLLTLTQRANKGSLPPVAVVDMREELRSGNRSIFSNSLQEALRDRLERGEQAVLLHNRRGYSTFVMCRDCGHTVMCPHCDIALTYHQPTKCLRCHYCGHTEPAPRLCPACRSDRIRFFGTGTQKVEQELYKQFPGIRVIRMDVDTTGGKHGHEELLKEFGERRADVLLGTQMVAKGLDFPYVTLVGVVTADTSLHLPDFRAAERTFQLLTQVAGRAGRDALPGEVVVQTYTPEHYAIMASQQHSFSAFYEEEMRHRSLLGYPPYGRIILVTSSHEDQALLSQVSEQFSYDLRDLAGAMGVLQPMRAQGSKALEVLGPTPAAISKINDRYRMQCVIKYRGSIDASAIVRQIVYDYANDRSKRSVLFSVDVDPQMIL